MNLTLAALLVAVSSHLVWSAEVTVQESKVDSSTDERNLDSDLRTIVQEELAAFIPKGFIYVQLPGKPSLKRLWPRFKWTNVSGEYAGHFFRVAGGNAEEFGKPQAENAPRFVHINSKLEKANSESERKDVEIGPGTNSERLWTGDAVHGRKNLISTSFTMSGGEVRPANYAVVIWERVR